MWQAGLPLRARTENSRCRRFRIQNGCSSVYPEHAVLVGSNVRTSDAVEGTIRKDPMLERAYGCWLK